MVSYVNESDVLVEEMLCINSIKTDVTSIQIKDIKYDQYRDAKVYTVSLPDNHLIYHIRKSVTQLISKGFKNEPLLLVSVTIYEYENTESRCIHNEQSITTSFKKMKKKNWNDIINDVYKITSDKKCYIIIPSSGIVCNPYFDETEFKAKVILLDNVIKYACQFIDYNMVYQNDMLYIDDKYFDDYYRFQPDAYCLEKDRYYFSTIDVGAPHYYRSEYAQIIGYDDNKKEYQILFKFTLTRVNENGKQDIINESGYLEINSIKEFKSVINKYRTKLESEIDKIMNIDLNLIETDARFIDCVVEW